jgi:Rrf2 family nitric oxide-sensitive transcriptional repressor
MRLTLHTDYAFRILMYLAANDKRLTTIDEIANYYKISKNHLVKVVNKLVKAGFIEAIRGKGGGMRLGLEAEKINLGSVIRVTEPDFALVECLSTSNSCVLTSICGLKHILNNAMNNFIKELEKYNIKEVTTVFKLASPL